MPIVESQPQADEAAEAPGRRPRRLVRWLRRLAALLILLGFLYAAREIVVHPLLVRLVGFAAPHLSPYRVEIGELDGNWFGWLRVEDLRVRATGEEGPVRTLEASSLAVHFSLFDLLRSGVEGIDLVEAKDVRGVVDLTRSEGGGESATDEPFRLPARIPRCDVQGQQDVDAGDRQKRHDQEEGSVDGVSHEHHAQAARYR